MQLNIASARPTYLVLRSIVVEGNRTVYLRWLGLSLLLVSLFTVDTASAPQLREKKRVTSNAEVTRTAAAITARRG
jgi:hypothetical protein